MAAEPTPHAFALGLEEVQTVSDARTDAALVSAQITRRLRIALPAINVLEVAVTYVFLTYVVPLPGPAPPAAARSTALVASVAVVAVCWLVCDLSCGYASRPVRSWLKGDRPPTAAERRRTLRLPIHEAGQVLAVWATAAIASFALDLALGGSAAGALLVAVMIVLGGLVASALSYLATERIMRPATALALASDPPTRPLAPGIRTRIYLAWEFGDRRGRRRCRRRRDRIPLGRWNVAAADGRDRDLPRCARAHHWGRDAVVRDPLGRRPREGDAWRDEHGGGGTDVTVTVDDGSEVGMLQAGFDRMVAGLRERDRVRDLFGRHVGEEVARSALGGRADGEMGGELRHAAILFVDVVGSTAFASTRDPREVVETLNRFFEIVVEVVTMHGGWINKFEGDAALCVFGAPTEHPDAAGAALGAARELARRLATGSMGWGRRSGCRPATWWPGMWAPLSGMSTR